MSSPHYSYARRRGAAVAVAACALFVALASCSSDPDSSLGSSMTDDLLGAQPGEVFQDTIAVFADTVYTYGTPIAGDSTLEFGRAQGYTRMMILQPSWEGAAQDANRTLLDADLRLTASSISGAFPARFYRLRATYAEGDTVFTPDTLYAIVDPTTGSPNRTLQSLPRDYALPLELVRGWISGDSARVAIGIVYTDDVNDRLATFRSQNLSTDRPQIRLRFADLDLRQYFIDADATVLTPLVQAPDLVVSDGYVRRTYFRIRLDELAEESAIHTARVRFHLVPDAVLGGDTRLVIYTPESASPSSTKFLNGQLVTSKDITDEDPTVEFTVTNAMFLMLQGSLDDNGFVIRLENENTELRKVELYGTGAPEHLRPRVYVTSSTPGDFRR